MMMHLRVFQVSQNSKLQNTWGEKLRGTLQIFRVFKLMLHSNIFFYPVTKYSLLLLMDRFITRIPKTPQNAVINLINQIRAVPEVSSKQASAEKISHEFIKKYFLEYKWLQKMKENYFARPAHFFRMNGKRNLYL